MDKSKFEIHLDIVVQINTIYQTNVDVCPSGLPDKSQFSGVFVQTKALHKPAPNNNSTSTPLKNLRQFIDDIPRHDGIFAKLCRRHISRDAMNINPESRKSEGIYPVALFRGLT